MMTLQSRIEAAIGAATGQPARLADSRVAGGGCINDSRIVTLRDGREFFVKSQPAGSAPGMFEMEYRALLLLREPGVIQVPAPVAHGEDFLVLEAFTRGTPAADWQERMGRALALLHQGSRAKRYGFEGDNYLGNTPQPNGWRDRWLDFWREQRLGWQLERYARAARPEDELLVLGESLMGRLGDWLGDIDEAPSLLHGDLWSGNAAAGEDGQPIIFDPASYYGHREAEIGMMRLFGGFTERCEAAYQEVWPLRDGAGQRIAIYRLYHQLNHLNLFGAGYYSGCVSTMKELLAKVSGG